MNKELDYWEMQNVNTVRKITILAKVTQVKKQPAENNHGGKREGRKQRQWIDRIDNKDESGHRSKESGL
ncbi:MAG: hypothetical protein AB1461_06815 [Thermodesulfobacteriota bacterium]